MASDSPRSRLKKVVATAVLALIVFVVVLDTAGVPSPGGGGSATSTYPTNPHRLVSNNGKVSDWLRLDFYTHPQSAVWILASSNTGPSYIGPYFVDLGPDWFVLQGPVLMGGGIHLQTAYPVPSIPGLVGLEFVVQCGVISPVASDVAFSNSVTLRVSQGAGKNVLILRQTTVMSGMTNAAQQADSVAAGLQLLGNQVTLANDALPASLLDFDCILDLRFSVAPAPDEAARLIQFLKSCGGVFFVAGPYSGCPPGQQRVAWLNEFLNTTLGIGVTIATGGSLSAGSVESIDSSADPAFLNAALGIALLPFDVTNEGGNFGPPGAASAGTPWLSGATMFGSLVYGMFFDHTEIPSQTVGGSIGVLFAGGASTFLQTSSSPYPELIMCNVAAYLDR